MTTPRFEPEQESIALRILWMLLFLLVWQVAQLVLGAVVLAQLACRLVQGAPNPGLMSFGDSLSRYLAQIGSFGSFHTEQKPWPFTDWPAAQPTVMEPPASSVVAPAPTSSQEPPL